MSWSDQTDEHKHVLFCAVCAAPVVRLAALRVRAARSRAQRERRAGAHCHADCAALHLNPSIPESWVLALAARARRLSNTLSANTTCKSKAKQRHSHSALFTRLSSRDPLRSAPIPDSFWLWSIAQLYMYTINPYFYRRAYCYSCSSRLYFSPLYLSRTVLRFLSSVTSFLLREFIASMLPFSHMLLIPHHLLYHAIYYTWYNIVICM